MKPRLAYLVLVPAAVGLASCAHHPTDAVDAVTFRVPRLAESVVVDGRLDERCYERIAPVTEFKVASRPGVPAPATKAWLLWDDGGLWFAFSARDDTIVSAPPSPDEHAVDTQDRVELFLWPEGSRRYFCLEIAPDGARHDYAARVYRQFDDLWSPAGLRCATRRTAEGYAVEGCLPVTALREMGVRSWQAGTRLHVGLYRADFRPDRPDDPSWLTWVEPHLPQPDFHVRATFSQIELAPD